MHYYLRLLAYLKHFKRHVAWVAAVALVGIALQGITVWVAADFITGLLAPGEAADAAPEGRGLVATLDTLGRSILSHDSSFASLVHGTAILVVLRLLVSVCQVFRYYMISYVSQTILATLRTDLFNRITGLDMSFSKRSRPGEVATVFVKDVDQLNNALFDVLNRMVLHPVRLVIILWLMMSQSVGLTLWILVFLAIGAAMVHCAGDTIEKLCRSVLEKIAALQGNLVEYLSSAILARLVNREGFERQRFQDLSGKIASNLVRLVFMRNLAPEVVRGMFALAGGGILIAGGHQVFVEQTLSSASLLRMILLLPLAVTSMERLASVYATIRVSLASMRRVFGLLDQHPRVPKADGTIVPGPFKDSIRLEGAGYEEEGHRILEDLRFSVPRGSKVVIYGSSGAGKSTLLGLLAGVLQCTSGRILVDGVGLADIKGSEWRRKLGVVTQEPILLNGTVRDNLKYVMPDADDDYLASVLTAAHMTTTRKSIDELLNTPVGNRGDLLSGGERQRLAIARALMTEPEILLMDEPTSMLDDAVKGRVRDTILAAAEGRTLILVTHDDSLRDMADLLVRIEDGRITIPDACENGE